ncbi:hypothetical protein FKP32DRAFT_1677952 [Trametes sanguinea]|nr:hypothetical protein FKP32DRAFT_1677952 [Trametes sanguinea]
MSMASLQAGLDALVPTSPSRSTTVAHDTTFDPRSPIQRGTLIPSDSPDRNALLRPSPMMLPLNSLLFS